MTLSEAYRKLRDELNILYDERESKSISLIILEAVGFSRLSVSLEPSALLPEEKVNFLERSMKKLREGIPVQYIIGTTEFFGYPFIVNEKVLIPRPETEELVSMIIDKFRHKAPVIMDIGTGTGCIAVSLAKGIEKAMVYAIDVSEDAIDVATKNAKLNKVSIEFRHDDVLNPHIDWGQDFFDVIVSNPPYVLEEDKKEMHKNVLGFEPSIALYADKSDPLLFYRRIFDFSIKYLKKNGVVYCEINEKLGEEMRILARDYGYQQVEVIKDINGKDRFIKAILNPKS